MDLTNTFRNFANSPDQTLISDMYRFLVFSATLITKAGHFFKYNLFVFYIRVRHNIFCEVKIEVWYTSVILKSVNSERD